MEGADQAALSLAGLQAEMNRTRCHAYPSDESPQGFVIIHPQNNVAPDCGYETARTVQNIYRA